MGKNWRRYGKGTSQGEVGTVGKISDCQTGGPGFNPRPGRGLTFRQPSFAALSMDRDVKPLV